MNTNLFCLLTRILSNKVRMSLEGMGIPGKLAPRSKTRTFFGSKMFFVVGVAGLPAVILVGGGLNKKVRTTSRTFLFVGVAGFEPATSCSQRGEKGYYFLPIYCVRALKLLVFPKVINFSVCWLLFIKFALFLIK